jgi:hypothetical protein
MKLDAVSHKLFIVAHKGCLIFDTLVRSTREKFDTNVMLD